MTPEGRKYVLMRLSQAPDIQALKAVWDSVSDEYKRDADIQAFKNLRKESLS